MCRTLGSGPARGAAARRRAAAAPGRGRAGARPPVVARPPAPHPVSPAPGGYPTPSFAGALRGGCRRGGAEGHPGRGERTLLRGPHGGRPGERAPRAAAARLPRARLLLAPPAPALREARLSRL